MSAERRRPILLSVLAIVMAAAVYVEWPRTVDSPPVTPAQRDTVSRSAAAPAIHGETR